MTSWRVFALSVGLLLAAGGLLMWKIGGGPVLLLLGLVALLTGALEPIYGAARQSRPEGRSWRPTEERFVDPQNGELVTVWFDSNTGERRYVADGEKPPLG